MQELQLPPGALELTRVRIAPVHDGGALGHPPIAFGVVRHLRVWRIELLLDRAVGGVSRCATAFSCTLMSTTTCSGSLVYRPAPEALLQQRGDLLLAQLLASAAPRAEHQVARITNGISSLPV